MATPLGISPFEALFGKQMSMGIDLQLLQQSENAPSTSAYVVDLVSKLQLIQDIVQQNMTHSSQRVKKILRYRDRDTANYGGIESFIALQCDKTRSKSEVP